MLQRMFLIYFILAASTSFGQNKIRKEYYCSEQDDYKKKLSSISYYDERGNIIRKVSISDDGVTGFDTTDYIYENNLPVKEVRYWGVAPKSRPVDTVLDYIRKHPAALGHSLHNIIKLHVSDTEMTKYYYDARRLLIKKENATFRDTNLMPEEDFYKMKLGDINATHSPVLRKWQSHLVTNYVYNKNDKLIEANGDLYDKSFGYYSEYISSVRRFFYNSKNEVVLDSIVSYNGTKFDGAVSNYKYFQHGHEIRVTEYDGQRPQYFILVFKLNDEGKILQETRYDTKSPESKIEDPLTRLNDKNIYEYDDADRLIKKSMFYNDTHDPQSIIYYTYE